MLVIVGWVGWVSACGWGWGAGVSGGVGVGVSWVGMGVGKSVLGVCDVHRGLVQS